MVKIASILSLLLIGSSSFAGITVDEKYLLPNATYVEAGASVTSTAASRTVVATRNTLTPKTFYLTHFSIEGFFNVISASATKLGTCSLENPVGSSVATWNFTNPTTSQLDRVVVVPALPIPVTSSAVFSCIPSGTTSTVWSVVYGGFEY